VDAGYATDVFDAHDAAADELVHSIVLANEAGRTGEPASAANRVARIKEPSGHGALIGQRISAAK
jgi:hypothetical protein